MTDDQATASTPPITERQKQLFDFLYREAVTPARKWKFDYGTWQSFPEESLQVTPHPIDCKTRACAIGGFFLEVDPQSWGLPKDILERSDNDRISYAISSCLDMTTSHFRQIFISGIAMPWLEAEYYPKTAELNRFPADDPRTPDALEYRAIDVLMAYGHWLLKHDIATYSNPHQKMWFPNCDLDHPTPGRPDVMPARLIERAKTELVKFMKIEIELRMKMQEPLRVLPFTDGSS